MTRQDTDEPNVLSEQTKDRFNLFYRIANLDEKTITISEALEKVSRVLADGWKGQADISISVEFEGQIHSRKGKMDEDGSVIEAVAEVRNKRMISIRVEGPEDHNFSKEDQQLISSMAVCVSTKVDRIIERDELKEQQKLLDKAYKLAHIGTWEYDLINDELYWSDVTKEVHGFGPDYEPDVESTIQLFKEGYHRDTFAKVVEDAIERYKPFDIELKIISGQGDERWIRATGEPEYEDGVCTRFYGISQNVTERRKAEEELELNDRRFRALVQNGMDIIAILDEELQLMYVSPTSQKILGYSSEFLEEELALGFVHEEDKKRLFRQFKTLAYTESIQLKPFRVLDASDEWRWMEAYVTNLVEDPAVRGFVANARDVTDRQIKQEEIIDALKEKETLLAEIHHRIKNNLSVLTGLLQMQASSEKNEEVINRLFDSVARINTMASIHEQLYQSNNFSSLDLADRVKLLALNIKKSFQTETEVELNFQCEPVSLPISRVLPCSLIVNEVLTNIFKHAFENRKEGKVTIELGTAQADDYLSLKISDNGVGLPEDFDPSQSRSLGLKLIDMLSDQLPAEYYFESSDKGTVFNLMFKKN